MKQIPCFMLQVVCEDNISDEDNENADEKEDQDE